MAIRSSQDSVFRHRYDSYPSWLQHSMFPDTQCEVYRATYDFHSRLEAANKFKLDGNELIKVKKYSDAIR